MNKASACVRCMKLRQMSKVASSPACRCKSAMKSRRCQCAGACSRTGDARMLMSKGYSLLQNDVLHWHVVVVAASGGLDGLDLVDHFGSGDDLAKHGVAPALR